MPKVAASALAWSLSQQRYALTKGEGLVSLSIVPDSPAWFAWLAQAPSFAFTGKCGSYTARKETKHGNLYWYAYLRTGEKLTKKYLGKTAGLTIARLEDVAALMQAAREALDTEPEPSSMLKTRQARRSIEAANTETSRKLILHTLPGTHGDSLTPLLSTKLHVPRPRFPLVQRSHLIERLQEGMTGALTLVSAPAGFGKTTLLAQWLTESATPVAWLSLEPEDTDPVRFLSYLIAALQTVEASFGTTALALLHAPHPPPPETILMVLTNEITRHAIKDFVLVLDDYHVLTAAPIERAMTFLVEHCPPQLHLLLATRADPPLQLARLRARRQLTELRAAQLQFEAGEAHAFLQTVMGLDLSAQEVAALQAAPKGGLLDCTWRRSPYRIGLMCPSSSPT